MTHNSYKLATDGLGFPLEVSIEVGDFESLGSHKTFYNHETGLVEQTAPHIIRIKSGLDRNAISMVVAHEVYHMFYSIRHLIACGEESEAETFGELVSKIINDYD